MKTFELAIFDYDGVLVDSLNGVIQAGRDFCRFDGHGCKPDREMITALHPMTYDQLARSIGLPLDRIEPFSAFVFSRLQQAGTSMPFFPGIQAMLRRRSPETTAVVSGNSREVIAAKLAAHGLKGNVGCILGAYEPGDKTAKIGRVCAQLGADPIRTCMVGDAASDIQYAQKAGVQSIAVTWGWQSRGTLEREGPDQIVASVAELVTLLE